MGCEFCRMVHRGRLIGAVRSGLHPVEYIGVSCPSTTGHRGPAESPATTLTPLWKHCPGLHLLASALDKDHGFARARIWFARIEPLPARFAYSHTVIVAGLHKDQPCSSASWFMPVTFGQNQRAALAGRAPSIHPAPFGAGDPLRLGDINPITSRLPQVQVKKYRCRSSHLGGSSGSARVGAPSQRLIAPIPSECVAQARPTLALEKGVFADLGRNTTPLRQGILDRFPSLALFGGSPRAHQVYRARAHGPR